MSEKNGVQYISRLEVITAFHPMLSKACNQYLLENDHTCKGWMSFDDRSIAIVVLQHFSSYYGQQMANRFGIAFSLSMFDY
jgi:hypothetical protein